MNKLFFFFVCLFCTGNSCYAQTSTERGPKCGIWYDYDKAGNRIKRYYDCKDPYTPEAPDELDIALTAVVPQATTSNKASATAITDTASEYGKVILYPNPTPDKFYIRVPKSGTHTHFHLYDAKGAIISSGNIDGELYEGHISNLPAGDYSIIVYYKDRSVPFKVTKI